MKAVRTKNGAMKHFFYLLKRSLKFSYQARNKLSIVISILGFGMALVPMFVSQILRQFTNSVYALYSGQDDNLRKPMVLLGILGCLYIIQTIYTALTNYYSREDTIRIHTFLKEYVMRCACTIQYKYIDGYDGFRERVEAIKTHTGEQVAKSMQQITVCLQKTVTFISLLLLLSSINLGIVLILIIATIPAILLSYFQKDEEYRQNTKRIKDGAFMMHYYNENVQPEPMNEVRFFGLTEYIKGKWRTAGEKFITKKNVITRKYVVYNCIADFLRNGVFIIVLIIVGRDIFNNPSLGLGVFLMVMTCASQFQNVGAELFSTVVQIVGNMRYMEDFFSFEKMDKDMSSNNKGIVSNPNIKFSHVYFSYPNSEHKILKDINIQIPFGQKVAIVGENGSGKSTFVNLLCGMYDSFEGDIYINDLSIKQHISEIRETISVAFQDFGRYEDTIRYNVKVSDMNKKMSDDEIINAIERAGGKTMLLKQEHGLDEVLGTFAEKTKDVSGGEWQKIALARTIYRDKGHILILDEPTAALDPLAEAELYKNFMEVTGDRTTLLISHRLGFSNFIDRILVFHQGKIVEDGTHEELLAKKGYYAKMFEAQAQWYN